MGHRPASTPPVVLDSGTTTNISTALDSAEEEETNGNDSSKNYKLVNLTIPHDADGGDVQAYTPDNSVDIPESISGSTSKKPVDEAGVCMCITCKRHHTPLSLHHRLHVYTHTHTHACKRTHMPHSHSLACAH